MKAVNIALLFAFVWVGAQAADGVEKNNPSHARILFSGGLMEGGETFASAQPMDLPFHGAGNSCDNLDDYDEACPYTGSTAPDAVYSFVPERLGRLSADLCGSSYDTKLMLYDENATLVACNDDYYTDSNCGMYVSFMTDILVQAGRQYFLVVDGFGNLCGDYQLKVDLLCEDPVCQDALCPSNGLLEGEPEPMDGYVDQYNGGCDSPAPMFQELFQLPDHQELNFCGSTGWYLRDGDMVRDTDWLKVVAINEFIHFEASSSHHMPVDVHVIRQQQCTEIDHQVFPMGICQDGVGDVPTIAGETVYFKIQPHEPQPGDCAAMNDLYTLKISGIFGTVVATENVTWDCIKTYYR